MHIPNLLKSLGFVGAAMLLLASCGGSDDGDDPVDLRGTIHLTAQSIAEGSEVDAATTNALTLTYDKMVSLATDKAITVNGTSVRAAVASTATAIDIPLDLEAGQAYTVVVPSDAVVGRTTPEATALGVTIHFTTAKAPEPVNPTADNFAGITNAHATAAAQKLYQYLVDNYGKTMLSGAMGGVAWENGYADYINATTGKYPAIVGYDYIHLGWSPANWIDYSKIAPVEAAWNAGSIIQIGWHWNTPSTEGAAVNTYGASYTTTASEVGNGAGNTTFDITQALTEGTWQNTFIKKDIEKVAGYLKLLQDAGIPVLFRPLHEAAGDYQQGAWFWWGAKGAEPCKKLWLYLYDQLTQTYGLNNLIWVWTAQTSRNGSLATVGDLQVWYPGDDYVDIVGADLYYDASGMNGWNKPFTSKQAYDLVWQSVGGKKMVVMSECGRLPVASECIAGGEPWGYFMTWYGTQSGTTWAPYSEWDTAAQLRTKMNDSGVTNRDGIGGLK